MRKTGATSVLSNNQVHHLSAYCFVLGRMNPINPIGEKTMINTKAITRAIKRKLAMRNTYMATEIKMTRSVAFMSWELPLIFWSTFVVLLSASSTLAMKVAFSPYSTWIFIRPLNALLKDGN